MWSLVVGCCGADGAESAGEIGAASDPNDGAPDPAIELVPPPLGSGCGRIELVGGGGIAVVATEDPAGSVGDEGTCGAVIGDSDKGFAADPDADVVGPGSCETAGESISSRVLSPAPWHMKSRRMATVSSPFCLVSSSFCSLFVPAETWFHPELDRGSVVIGKLSV